MTADEEFTEFVTTAWPLLYRTAHLLVGDRGLAEDLVQTSLAKTYLSWGRVRDRGAAGVYARTVLVNTAVSWFRRHSWRREVATAELPDGGVPGADARADARADASADADRTDLAVALRTLPPRQRAVVVLRFYEDLSVEQTAQALRITPGTVKSQTSHALAKLRLALGEAFHLEGAHHD